MFMFVKRNIWKCDGIQLSLLFVVYSDKKNNYWPVSEIWISGNCKMVRLFIIKTIKVENMIFFAEILTISFMI